MKYISYTFIDDATQIPVSKEPAKKGPIMPEGVEHVFSVESSFTSGVPQFYGTLEDESLLQDWMGVISEGSFLQNYKDELKNRTYLKRKTIQREMEKDLKGLLSISQAVMAGVDLQSFDFLSSSGWKVLTGFEVLELYKVLCTKQQNLFSLVNNIEKCIDSSSLIDMAGLSEQISSINVESL